MTNKIGVGVITCNRETFFDKCIRSVPSVDCLVVINDGNPYSSKSYPNTISEVKQHSRNMCIGISKNEALRYLIQQGCDHLFLIEDDMLITNPNVFEHYIHGAEESGIWHMNFGYHGPANKKDGKPCPRQTVTYTKETLALNPNCVGAFSYYYRGIIKHCGYMDERYKNAWEHVEHTYRIIKDGLHPPFWWFADMADSHQYISEQACSEVASTIRKTPEWLDGMRSGARYFESKHGTTPVQVPDTHPDVVIARLKQLEERYAKVMLQ